MQERRVPPRDDAGTARPPDPGADPSGSAGPGTWGGEGGAGDYSGGPASGRRDDEGNPELM